VRDILVGLVKPLRARGAGTAGGVPSSSNARRLLATFFAAVLLNAWAPLVLLLSPGGPICRMACAGTAHCCCRPVAGPALRLAARASSGTALQALSTARSCPPGCAAAFLGSNPSPVPLAAAAARVGPSPSQQRRPSRRQAGTRDLRFGRQFAPRAPPSGSLAA